MRYATTQFFLRLIEQQKFSWAGVHFNKCVFKKAQILIFY